MSVFRKNDKIYIVNKDSMETYEQFIERGNFVASQTPLTEQEYENVVLYSHIYVNNKYLQCIYKEEIMDKLDKMLSKCKVT